MFKSCVKEKRGKRVCGLCHSLGYHNYGYHDFSRSIPIAWFGCRDGQNFFSKNINTFGGYRLVGFIDRKPLIEVMKRYFALKGFETDWAQIDKSDNHQLLATLSMICPFAVAEKQALLEADTMAKRADLLIVMMEMALHSETGGNSARH